MQARWALWLFAFGLSVALVAVWAWAERRFAKEHGEPIKPLPWIVGKGVLLAVLTVALHAALDPDHDRHTFSVHAPAIARGVYAFAVTAALLFAFPQMRIWAGAGLMAIAVTGMEGLQFLGLVPGQVRLVDWWTALLGVAVAAGPMWIGAQRARRNMARDLAEAAGRRPRDKTP